MKRILLFAIAVQLLVGNAFSWGNKGHDVTCAIAARHLSKEAQSAVTSLLDGKSMIYYAAWMDQASNNIQEHLHTKSWHYKNIDANETFDNAKLSPKGDILTALDEQIAILKDTGTTQEKKSLALKFLIHLIGDLHQPLHLGHLSDYGGNTWKVTFFKRETDLHTVWDSYLVEATHDWSHTEWAEELDIPDTYDILSIQTDSPRDWAYESYVIAQQIYRDTPQDSNISYAYVLAWTPVIERQFLRGGLRLAKTINEIFK